jgi:hypothetical protein
MTDIALDRRDIYQSKAVSAIFLRKSECFSACHEILNVSTDYLGSPALAHSRTWGSAQKIVDVFSSP